MPMRKKYLAMAVVAIAQNWVPLSALADNTPTSKLDEVTVTATRGTSGDINRAAATVSVITADEIEQQNAKDIKDALRYEPGVDVRRSTYRTGGVTGVAATTGRGSNEGINIRGLDGNRVLLLEDGVSLPRSFSVGTLFAGRGSYLDTDLYQRIEVLRGPASSMYGSDGLTGAVNFITKDPQDYLNVFGNNTYFSVRPSYDSVDHSFGTNGTIAFGSERWQAMLLLNARHGKETDNKGENDIRGASRTTPDPLTYDARSALAKVVFRVTARDTFKWTLGATENKLRADSLSAITTSVTGYRSTSDVNSNRFGFAYEHDDLDAVGIQKIRANAYYRNAKTNQYSYETGTSSATITRPRYRDVNYQDDVLGANVLLESGFASGNIKHKLVYGIDTSVSIIKSSAGGTGWNSCTGTEYCEYFPKTQYSVFGAYIQDEMRVGQLSVMPGLRYDAYELDPKASARYDAQANANGQPASKAKDNALSPRLALIYEISPALIPYAQYARGFRSPSPQEVNSYFRNVTSTVAYSQIANPNLKPETSDSYEIGLRGKTELGASNLRYSAAVFSGKYKNFIELVTLQGSANTPTNPAINQYINASRASIHGVEGKIDWRSNSGWGVRSGFAYTEGKTTNRNGVETGLESVSPLSVVAGVRYEQGRQWFVQTDVIYNAAKKAKDIPTQTNFVSPSFTILDVSGGYRFSKNVSANIGIRNLFDRKYWVWNDIRGLGLASTATNLDAYTSPGRSINASLKIEY